MCILVVHSPPAGLLGCLPLAFTSKAAGASLTHTSLSTQVRRHVKEIHGSGIAGPDCVRAFKFGCPSQIPLPLVRIHLHCYE